MIPPSFYPSGRQREAYPKAYNGYKVDTTPAMPQVRHISVRLVMNVRDAKLEGQRDSFAATVRA